MQAFGIELPRQARLAAMVLAIAGLAICPPAVFAQKTTDQDAAKPAEESFEATPAFDWLQRHAGASGFAMSYPRGNPHGIVYEPWHWRYLRADG